MQGQRQNGSRIRIRVNLIALTASQCQWLSNVRPYAPKMIKKNLPRKDSNLVMIKKCTGVSPLKHTIRPMNLGIGCHIQGTSLDKESQLHAGRETLTTALKKYRRLAHHKRKQSGYGHENHSSLKVIQKSWIPTSCTGVDAGCYQVVDHSRLRKEFLWEVHRGSSCY